MNPLVRVTHINSSKRVIDALAKLGHQRVLVGIPADTTANRFAALSGMAAAGRVKGARKRRLVNATLDVTNAQLMFIQSKGSPIQGIPARPVIEPAIVAQGNKEAITAELAGAAKSTLDGDAAGTTMHLKRAGMAGQRASQKWFTDPRANLAPNAPSTIARKGSDRPLIDSGALRAALTYVVEEN